MFFNDRIFIRGYQTRRSRFACLIPALMACLAIGCFLPDVKVLSAQETKKKIVVCSTTQIADFAAQVGGDWWEVNCVLAPGEDPHTYEVGNDDLLSVKRADLCLENGWNLEGHAWMTNLAKTAGKPIKTCVDGIEPLKLIDEGEAVKDPHAWFSTYNAIIYVQNIRDAMSGVDPDHSDEYTANANRYIIELRTLNHWIGVQVNAIPRSRRILVTHHDAFGYFSKAYGLSLIHI